MEEAEKHRREDRGGRQVGTRDENKNMYLKDSVIKPETHCREVLLSGFSLSTFIIKNQKTRMEGALSPPLSQGARYQPRTKTF